MAHTNQKQVTNTENRRNLDRLMDDLELLEELAIELERQQGQPQRCATHLTLVVDNSGDDAPS